MKYLDEDIIVTIQNIGIPPKGVYNYDIVLNGNTIFYGNVFVPANTSALDIDITDIIKNYKFNDVYINKNTDINNSLAIDNIIGNIIVRLYIDSSIIGGYEQVAFIYRYPHYNKEMSPVINIADNDQIILQGYNFNSSTTKFVPHIPFVKSDNFTFGLVNYLSNNNFDRRLLFNDGIIREDIHINYNSSLLPYWSLQSFKLSTLFDDVTIADASGKIHQECMHRMAEFYGGSSVLKSNDEDTYYIKSIPNDSSYVIELCDVSLNTISSTSFTPTAEQRVATFAFSGNPELEYIKIGSNNENNLLLNVGNLFKQTDAQFTLKFTNTLIAETSTTNILEIKDISIDCYSKYKINKLTYDMSDINFELWSSGVQVSEYPYYRFAISYGDWYGINFELQNSNLPGSQTFYMTNVNIGGEMHYKLGYKNDGTMTRCNVYSGSDKTSGNWLVFSENHTENSFVILDTSALRYQYEDVIEYYLDNKLNSYTFNEITNSNNRSIYFCGYDVTAKIADVDVCPAKYYLKWSDRYIGWQVQGFDGKSTYKENFNTTNIETYNGVSHPINISITPSWEINTKWIDEELYPYYESIFVSEKLVLYDVENDMSYNVIVTDKNFTERTFKNSKKQFNLTLNLQMAKKQNIIY